MVQLTQPETVPAALRAFRDWKPAGEAALAAYIVAVLERSRPGMIIEPRYVPAAAPRVLSDENLDNLGRVIVDALPRAAA